MNKLIIAIIGIILMLPSVLWAACVADGDNWASTPDYTSVASCVSQADAGDTITVSAGDGSEDWGSTLAITKGVSLIGPGAANLTIKRTGSSHLITYKPSNYALNSVFEISGFKFDANNGDHNGSTLKLGDADRTSTLQTNIKIHDNIFSNSSGTGGKGSAIYNKSIYYGVVYNNTFEHLDYPMAHTTGIGDNSWWGNSPENTFAIGSQYYLYFEDNTINLEGTDVIVTDGEYSARYAFRYNDISVPTNCYNLFDVHGEQATPMDASFGAELYGNDVTHTGYTLQFSDQRSGQMIVAFNKLSSVGSYTFNAYTSAACVCPNDAYDALKVTHDSYYFSNRANYNGTLGGVQASGGLSCNGLTGIPTAGRDVFGNNTTPGVGCGTSLPGTCTTGAGYWIPASGQDGICTNLTGYVGVSPSTVISGILYKCTATNTWTAFYVPYTYPHPLRQGETPDTTAPILLSSHVDTTGLIYTMVFSETVDATTKTGLHLDGSVAGEIEATYKAGMPGNIITWDLNKEVQQGETVTYTYATPGTGIKDLAGNAFSDGADIAVTNNSEQDTPPLVTLAVTATNCTVQSTPVGINCGSTCSEDYDTNTVVALSATCSQNYQNAVWSGTGCGASTIMSEARNCTATCSKIASTGTVGSGCVLTIGNGASATIY